jgi:hypothetical protein
MTVRRSDLPNRNTGNFTPSLVVIVLKICRKNVLIEQAHSVNHVLANPEKLPVRPLIA